MNIADNIRNTRNNKGISQLGLALMTGLHVTAISHFESGRRKPNMKNLIKLADALSVTTDELLGRTKQ